MAATEAPKKSLLAALAGLVGGSAEAAVALALVSVVAIVGGTAWVLKLGEEPPKRAAAPAVVQPAAPAETPAESSAPIAWAEEIEDEMAELEQQRQAEALAATSPPASGPKPKPAPPVFVRAKLDWNSCDPPRYPRDSLRNREEGAVVMAFLVNAQGQVTDKRVDQRSGSAELDRTALNAIASCRFSPALRNGVAESAWAKVRFVWKLNPQK